jgi:hypothetical protein
MELPRRSYYVYNRFPSGVLATYEPVEGVEAVVITVLDDGCNYAQRANHMTAYGTMAHRHMNLERPLNARHTADMLRLIADVGMIEAITVLEARVQRTTGGTYTWGTPVMDLTDWYVRAHEGSHIEPLIAARTRCDIYARVLMMRIMHTRTAMRCYTRFIIGSNIDEGRYREMQDIAFIRRGGF